MYEDARGTLSEAVNLVTELEPELAQQESSAKAFSERGWGGGKSIEELWADVWAAVSSLFPPSIP